MEQRGDQTVETETEASAGSKEGVVRWVLLIGLGLAIAFLTIIWMTGALSQGDVEEEATVSGIIESQADDRGEPIAPTFGDEGPATGDVEGESESQPTPTATQAQ